MMKKTAFVLSGGGSRGAYEIGVWKALCELGVNIDMVMGTSVGAINGAMIAQGDLPLAEKLWKELETEMVFDLDEEPTALAYAHEIVAKGGAGNSGLRELLEKYIDEEAIRKSHIQYGLVTTEYPTFEGHSLFIEEIPEGQLIDYILASAACFPAVQKCIIDDKKFIDGGYRDNLPVEMALEKGATSIIAVDLQAVGVIRRDIMEKARNTSEEFHLIKSRFDLGNFLIFDRVNTAKIMGLGYLETMKEWGKYDGGKYTFHKGIFTTHQLKGADNAADMLELDPCCIYDERTLVQTIAEQFKDIKTLDKDMNVKEIINIIKSESGQIKIQMLLFIARSLKEDAENSVFMQPALFKLLEDEIQAANFLINEKII